MVRRTLRRLGLLLVASVGVGVAACSSGGGSGTTPTSTPTPSPTPADTLQANVSAYLNLQLGSADNIGSAAVPFQVTLSSTTISVSNAAVAFGVVGRTLVSLTGGARGIYQGTQVGYGTAYGVSVQDQGEVLRGVVFPAPHDFSPTLTPSSPAVAGTALLSWVPTPGANWNLHVYQMPANTQTFVLTTSGPGGAKVIPGSAFPAPAVYLVELQQVIQTSVAGTGGHGSLSTIGLLRRLHATVP